MDQTKDPVVQDAYSEFLATGRLPRRLPAPSCPPQGREIEVFHGLEIAPPSGSSASWQVGGSPLALGDAAFAELGDIVRLPGRTLIVSNDARPVDLTFEADGLRFGVTDLNGSGRGAQRVYGPVTGTVVLGDDGVVTVDGVPAAPVPSDDHPGPDVTPEPPSTPPTPATPTPPAGAGPQTGTPKPAVISKRCRLARRALANAKTNVRRTKRVVRKRPSKASRKRLARARKTQRTAAAKVKRVC
jgi:hypothetical protein